MDNYGFSELSGKTIPWDGKPDDPLAVLTRQRQQKWSYGEHPDVALAEAQAKANAQRAARKQHNTIMWYMDMINRRFPDVKSGRRDYFYAGNY